MSDQGSNPSFGRIVLFRPGQFGDTPAAFPVIEALRRACPSTHILLCTNRFHSSNMVLGREVARLSPFIDEVVEYYVEDSVPQKWLDLSRQLRVRARDLLLYLPDNNKKRPQIFRDWLFFKSLGFRHMAGFGTAWRWAETRSRSAVSLPKESDRLVDVARAAGISVEVPQVCVIREDQQWADQQWRNWGLVGRDVLAICLGSKMQSKRWPLERYVEVGRRWHSVTGAALVVVGGPEEAEMAGQVVREWGGYGYSTCGATLAQTAAILSRARAYCGNDTGSMHLAALLGVPCVALFSSIDRVGLWFPFGNGHVVLRNDISCANCMLETCFADPPICLELTSVQRVLDALARVWDLRSVYELGQRA